MPNGIVVIDKPAGWTSMDVCAKVRGILHEKRVGHAGTLDPMATGVLPVFVGMATKALRFAENGSMEYLAGLRLGLTTDTQDITGETLETHPVSVTSPQLERIFARFTGEIQQVPPMYSAVKIHGRKLCDLARKGEQVERAPRTVTIFRLELLEQTGEREWLFRCLCSKGTYVRTLCHDIGAALGCGGCMSSLRRTMAAGFSLDRAVTLDCLQERGESLLTPLDVFFAEYPAYTVPSAGAEERCRHGNPLTDTDLRDGTYRVYGREGDFLCLSSAQDGVLRAVKNFFRT